MKNNYQHITFISGAHTLAQTPADSGIEVAFAGRSNAGKSSAINTITGLKALARVSKTPGRTQQINFFAVDEQRRLVDLPGYGYAKVPEQMRRHWQHTLAQYLQGRRSLGGLMLVMDVRHALSVGDLQVLDWCHEVAMPVHMLLTKADKLSRGQACASLEQVRRTLCQRYSGKTDGAASPAAILAGLAMEAQLFSALKRSGVDEARGRLDAWFQLETGDKKSPDSKGGRIGAKK